MFASAATDTHAGAAAVVVNCTAAATAADMLAEVVTRTHALAPGTEAHHKSAAVADAPAGIDEAVAAAAAVAAAGTAAAAAFAVSGTEAAVAVAAAETGTLFHSSAVETHRTAATVVA